VDEVAGNGKHLPAPLPVGVGLRHHLPVAAVAAARRVEAAAEGLPTPPLQASTSLFVHSVPVHPYARAASSALAWPPVPLAPSQLHLSIIKVSQAVRLHRKGRGDGVCGPAAAELLLRAVRRGGALGRAHGQPHARHAPVVRASYTLFAAS